MAYITFQPSDYFNTKLWTGTGSENAITGVGFQPDWVWIKQRNTTRDHNAFDAVRGATKRIYPNATNAEETAAQVLKSFDSDGFTLGTDTSANQSSGTYVSWNWRANGQGSSNSDGTITTTYTSANTTAGISIIKYTGNGTNDATIGHGLGVAPQILIGKCIGNTSNWQVVGKTGALTEGKYLQLNTNDVMGTSSNVSFDPTATTVKFQGGQHLNTSGQPCIAYCFTPKKGFSSMGTYLGNGNASGPFIYTGFKPGFVLIKKATGSVEHWYLFDSKRTGFNGSNPEINADLTGGESAGSRIDILSNGFKPRQNNTSVNNDNSTYFYIAFAEEPLVSSNNIPATAR